MCVNVPQLFETIHPHLSLVRVIVLLPYHHSTVLLKLFLFQFFLLGFSIIGLRLLKGKSCSLLLISRYLCRGLTSHRRSVFACGLFLNYLMVRRSHCSSCCSAEHTKCPILLHALQLLLILFHIRFFLHHYLFAVLDCSECNHIGKDSLQHFFVIS
jgi:hypothetical protein